MTDGRKVGEEEIPPSPVPDYDTWVGGEVTGIYPRYWPMVREYLDEAENEGALPLTFGAFLVDLTLWVTQYDLPFPPVVPEKTRLQEFVEGIDEHGFVTVELPSANVPNLLQDED